MTAESSSLTTSSTLAEFFKNEVDSALREQQLDASEEVGFYLVNLLAGFAEADRVRESITEPLALLLNRAVFAPDQNQLAAYKHLGDISLYVAGLFPPALKRRSVDVNYAIRMGSGAYSAVAALVTRRSRAVASALQPMYTEMSAKFADLVEVLTQISERAQLGADSQDLAELYERFARTSGPHLAERMRAAGALPGRAGGVA